MDDGLRRWLFDPAAGRLIASGVALLAVYVMVRLVRRVLGRYMPGPEAQYRARKFVAVLGSIVAIGLLGAIYSDRLGGLTVAFGVAGAGVAFALQEVIASVAGWLTVVVGGFYRVGDRIQLAGVRGDVIDVGILRTTLMECGEWVDGDLYSGRIVRVANSFVFKQPVFNYSGDFPFLWDYLMPLDPPAGASLQDLSGACLTRPACTPPGRRAHFERVRGRDVRLRPIGVDPP